MCSSVEKLEYLINLAPLGYKSPEDEIFVACNNVLVPEFKKLGVITDLKEAAISKSTNNTNFLCNSCKLVFETATDYQVHYNNVHRFICATCKRNMQTAHLLDLHVSEEHDAYFQACVDRGEKMFACFLEGCTHLTDTQTARKEHCITMHKFPANFPAFSNFRSKQNESCPKQRDQTKAPDNKLAQVKLFTFGHNRERAFSSRRKAGDALNEFNDLKQALADI